MIYTHILFNRDKEVYLFTYKDIFFRKGFPQHCTGKSRITDVIAKKLNIIGEGMKKH